MSIEEKLSTMTDALNRNSDLLEQMLSGGKATAASAGAKAGTTAAAAPKAAAKKPAGKKAAPTEEAIRTAFGAYMSGTKDKAEREERKGYVAKIIEYFGAARVTDIAEESREQAMSFVESLTNGDVPEELADEGDGDGDDDDALL